MYREEEQDTQCYKVVINHEEQYSIWPTDRDNPLGWFDVGQQGSKQDCLDYIDNVWTDMRPLSLRQQMVEPGRQPLPPTPAPSGLATASERPTESLVERLSTGAHPIVASRVDASVSALQQSVERGLLHLTFIETQGVTELGVTLDRETTDLSQADFAQATGVAHLVGELHLNDIHVRCRADIDLATLRGTGHLEPVQV